MFADVIVAAVAADASVSAIAAGVAALGTDLSVVGAITGNKTLTQIGGVMGLAGGVVGLADGAFSAATSAATDTGAGIGASGAGGIGASSDGYYGASAASNATSGSTGLLNSATADTPAFDSTLGGAVNSSTTDPMQSSTEGYQGASTTGGIQAPGANGTPSMGGANGVPAAPGSTDPNQLANESTKQGAQSNLLPGTSQMGAAPTPTSDPSQLQQIWKSLDPKVQAAVVQGGFGMVGGLFNGWTQEQKLALQQQAQNLQQTQYNTAMTNASSQPTIAAYKAPPTAGTGLLNSPLASNT